MIASVWLLLSSLFYSLQLHSGSFPKPLSAEEERHYLELSAQVDGFFNKLPSFIGDIFRGQYGRGRVRRGPDPRSVSAARPSHYTSM